MNVGTVCNRTVVFAYMSTPLNEAARLMREHHVGTLVVVEETPEGRVPLGMITDRDLAVAVVAKDLDARNLTTGEAMSGGLVTVREDDSVTDALRMMRRSGVRRVPVLGPNGVLVGIVTVDDLLEIVAEQLADIVSAIRTEQKREARTRP